MKIFINKQETEVFEGETILQVCQRNKIDIPTLCYLSQLFPSGACRMCVVEVAGQKNLVTSCSHVVSEGMSVFTHSPRVLKSRKILLELILSSHPDDCLYCEKNGHCELQKLAETLDVRGRPYANANANLSLSEKRKRNQLDVSSPSIIRTPSKCILCGRCVRVCEEIQNVSSIDFVNRGSQTVVAPAFHQGLNLSSCVNCGQCINVCPTAALTEKSSLTDVLSALHDPEKVVMVQHAPTISVTIGEYFGLSDSGDVSGILTAALRKVGFSRVFDTSFGADLTVMEEASELIHRVTNNKPLPMFTSCSPAWVKFVEEFYPDMIPHLSTCKSPQQMMGAMLKNYYAPKEGIDPKNVFVVSIMPCTAKKFERGRPEMGTDVDAVITTRELAKLLKMLNVKFKELIPSEPDSPLGTYSSAGKIFGVTGGVMEAAVRTASFLLTGKECAPLEFKEVRELQGLKEASVNLSGTEIKIAVVSGLGKARYLIDEIKAGRKHYHFVEVMSCPGGCIAGGGQPYGLNLEMVEQRMKKLYQIDKKATLRCAHNNPAIKEIYETFLGAPLSEKSHHLLHTHYLKREYCL